MGRMASTRAALTLLLPLGVAGLAAGPAPAQMPPPSQGLVVRDETLGTGRGEPVGPGTDPLGRPATYLITPELGEQHGGNLFHSFKSFGIGKDETATFTGPDPVDGPQSVSNVISRVTGPEASQIDGTLHSTIPGADVWLLNPSGVVFGAGAKVDVPGSFHAGTGDYVALADGARFTANPAQQGVLTTAPPAAFGFLPGTHAEGLQVNGSALSVGPGKTLELAAGHLTLTGAQLLAPGGHVGLEAQGEVALSQSLVDVGREGDTPGTIAIRGGQIVVERGSRVLAENESPVAPDPAAADLPGPGSISVDASESLLVDDHSLLSV